MRAFFYISVVDDAVTHLPQVFLQVRSVNHQDFETSAHNWEGHALVVLHIHVLRSVIRVQWGYNEMQIYMQQFEKTE